MRKFLILIITSCAMLGILTSCSSLSNKKGKINPAVETSQEPDGIRNTDSGGQSQENLLEENVPDLTGETIVLYLIGDTTPPFTSITSPMRNAAGDYVEYLNENGGLFGAKIEIRFADTGGSEMGVITAYKRFAKGDDSILLLINYSANEEPLYELVHEDKIPLITFGFNPNLPEIDNGGYIYRLSPTYDEQFVFFMKYVLENWVDIKPDGSIDEIKVAYISWDNAYGRSALSEESREFVEGLGIEIVSEEYLQMSNLSSTTSAIFNAETAGATVIYTNTHDFGPAILLNDIQNLALRDFFIVGGNNWAFDYSMLNYLFDQGYARDFYVPSWYAWWTDTDNLGIQLAERILVTNGRTEEDKVLGRLLVQGGLDLACHAIEQAILMKGYGDISSEDIKIVLDEISGYEVMKGLFTVDFSRGNYSPTSLQIRQVQADPGVSVVVEGFVDIPDFKP